MLQCRKGKCQSLDAQNQVNCELVKQRLLYFSEFLWNNYTKVDETQGKYWVETKVRSASFVSCLYKRYFFFNSTIIMAFPIVKKIMKKRNPILGNLDWLLRKMYTCTRLSSFFFVWSYSTILSTIVTYVYLPGKYTRRRGA